MLTSIDDADARELRLSNIAESQKKIQRLHALVYFVILLYSIAWFHAILGQNPIENEISRLDRALAVEELRPWDSFLHQTASCFHSHFYFNESGVVTREKLLQYIEHYKSENIRLDSLIAEREVYPYPLKRMHELLDSDDHWQDVIWWARQDTMLSFLGLGLFWTAYAHHSSTQ
jgi:aromatic ring-cleaving dioxygenase